MEDQLTIEPENREKEKRFSLSAGNTLVTASGGKIEITGILPRQGGMSELYVGDYECLKRLVVIKMPLAGMESRFRRREQAVAFTLQHANIIRMIEAGEFEGRPFLVMEYIAGRNLVTLMNERIAKEGKAIHWKKACLIIRQIAEAIQVGHSAGIIHRDIKPDNIILDEEGSVKVLDWGLIRVISEEETQRDSESVMRDEFGRTYQRISRLGTMGYMAPEQAYDPTQATIRSDLYGLGCTFYYLMSGFAPYATARSFEQYVALQLSDIPVNKLRSQTFAELAQIEMPLKWIESIRRWVIVMTISGVVATVIIGLWGWMQSLVGGGLVLALSSIGEHTLRCRVLDNGAKRTQIPAPASVPEPIDKVVDTLMRKRPEDRYVSIEDFLSALKNAQRPIAMRAIRQIGTCGMVLIFGMVAICGFIGGLGGVYRGITESSLSDFGIGAAMIGIAIVAGLLFRKLDYGRDMFGWAVFALVDAALIIVPTTLFLQNGLAPEGPDNVVQGHPEWNYLIPLLIGIVLALGLYKGQPWRIREW